ncbi:MAG: restriction endonuclease subunit S [Treponema sp.]|nr:restriction endonuclease subunit S [Spirochaetales bacterium]MDY6189541.1 restriction endonuclease subunit S [Treponema sp.]
MPEGWAWTKIHCVSSEILYGVSESAKETGKYKLLRITDIQDDQVNWDSVPFTDFPEDKVSNYILKNGDIVFARTGATVGKSYLIENLNIESIYASYLIRIRTSLLLNPRYMKYYFGSLTYWNQITDKSSGIGQPNVNGTSLANLYIPIPPYNEQERILPVIEKVFMLIDSLENDKDKLENLIKVAKSKILDLAIHGKLVPQDPNDEPAEELLKRIATSDNRPYKKFEEEFDYEIPKNWRFCKVKDVCSVIMGQSPEGEAVSDDKNGMEFHQGKICFGKKYLEESSSFTKHITKIAPKDSVLLCVRAPVGIVNITEREICIGRGLCAVIPKYTINSDFWFYWLQSLQSNFEQKATGTTFRAISVDVIKNQIVAIPPHEEQNRIVNKINELYEQLDKIVLNLV